MFYNKKKGFFVNKLYIFYLKGYKVSRFYYTLLKSKLYNLDSRPGRMEKYNLDFSLDVIHKFHSSFAGKDLPIHWNLNLNLNSVDLFFETLSNNISTGVKEKLVYPNYSTLSYEESAKLDKLIFFYYKILLYKGYNIYV